MPVPGGKMGACYAGMTCHFEFRNVNTSRHGFRLSLRSQQVPSCYNSLKCVWGRAYQDGGPVLGTGTEGSCFGGGVHAASVKHAQQAWFVQDQSPYKRYCFLHCVLQNPCTSLLSGQLLLLLLLLHAYPSQFRLRCIAAAFL